jgi:hypothetical protein
VDGFAFDRVVRALVSGGSRRRLLGLLGLGSLSGWLIPPEEAAEAAGRRKRRKKRHHHQQGDGKRNRKGQQNGKDKGKQKCKPEPSSITCAGRCATVTNKCGGQVDCGPCTCATGCPQCQTCDPASGLCVPVANGTTCDDGDGCTQSDTCQGGVCAGTPISCPTGQTCQVGVCGVSCGSDFCRSATEICDGGTCQACDVCLGAGLCAYTSIQAAINATPQLQTIRVCAGTYFEDSGGAAAVDIGRDLTLIGAGHGNDPLSDTIVRPQLANRIVLQTSVPSGLITVTLRALRITGGTGDGGCGMALFRSHVTVNSCTIIDNHPALTGGGGILISFDTSQVSLINTHVLNNSARVGGGILVDEAQLTLDDASRVTGNTATGVLTPSGTVFGGGIFAESGASVVLASADNVTGNTPNNCRVDSTGGSFSGPGAVCTST